MGISPGSSRSPWSWMLRVPVPPADLADEVVAGQVEVQGGDGDVALAEARDVRLGPLEIVRGVVGHPVICPPARVLPALEALAVAAQSHGHHADALGLAPRVG